MKACSGGDLCRGGEGEDNGLMGEALGSDEEGSVSWILGAGGADVLFLNDLCFSNSKCILGFGGGVGVLLLGSLCVSNSKSILGVGGEAGFCIGYGNVVEAGGVAMGGGRFSSGKVGMEGTGM